MLHVRSNCGNLHYKLRGTIRTFMAARGTENEAVHNTEPVQKGYDGEIQNAFTAFRYRGFKFTHSHSG